MRPYKPVETHLYNFPAEFVDQIAGLDLRLPAHFARAHELAEQIPIDEEENETPDDHRQRINQIHRELWTVKDSTPLIRLALDEMAAERAQRAEELQSGWSEHHEQKQNCYSQWHRPLEINAPITPIDGPRPCAIERISASSL